MGEAFPNWRDGLAFFYYINPLAELNQCVLNPSDRFVINVIDIL